MEEVDRDVRRWLRRHSAALTDSLRAQLNADLAAARRREDERYRQRQGEVPALIEHSTLARWQAQDWSTAMRSVFGQPSAACT